MWFWTPRNSTTAFIFPPKTFSTHKSSHPLNQQFSALSNHQHSYYTSRIHIPINFHYFSDSMLFSFLFYSMAAGVRIYTYISTIKLFLYPHTHTENNNNHYGDARLISLAPICQIAAHLYA